KKLRREGSVPAIIYGSRQDNYGVELQSKELQDLLQGSSSDNILVNLMIDGAKEQNKLALIQDIQHHPLSSSILHVDFLAVDENEPIVASVPIELTGECIGAKEGGLVDQQLKALDVRCLPGKLPEVLKADITELGVGGAFHVREVTWPEGVEAVVSGDVVVAICAELRAHRVDDDAQGDAAGGAPAEEGGAAEESSGS
ncbi:MAG: 50S ribosomal protein L25, partial [Verrucomicrobiota bacterium]